MDPADAVVWDSSAQAMTPAPEGEVSAVLAHGGGRAILFGLTGVSRHLVHDRLVRVDGSPDAVRIPYDGLFHDVLHHGVSRAGVLRGWRVLFTHDFLQLFLCRLALGLSTTFTAFLRERLVAFGLSARNNRRVLSLLRSLFRELSAVDGDDCNERVTRSFLQPFIGSSPSPQPSSPNPEP